MEPIAMSRKPKIKTQISTVTTKRHALEIDARQIREMLAKCCIDVPSSATIQFHVPGGGDWSNAALDIDADHPIHIEWSETEST